MQHPPNGNINPYEIKLIREMFERGIQRKVIAEKIGRAYSTVCYYLNGRGSPWPPEKVVELTEALKANGKKWQKVGKLIGRTPEAVKNYYRRHLAAFLDLPTKQIYREEKKPGPKGELLGPSKPPRRKLRRKTPVTAMLPKFASHAHGVIDPWDEDAPIGGHHG